MIKKSQIKMPGFKVKFVRRQNCCCKSLLLAVDVRMSCMLITVVVGTFAGYIVNVNSNSSTNSNATTNTNTHTNILQKKPKESLRPSFYGDDGNPTKTRKIYVRAVAVSVSAQSATNAPSNHNAKR